MNYLIKVIFSFCALSAILIGQQAYVETWFNLSGTQIVHMQKDASVTSQKLWRIYSDWGLTLIYYPPLIILYLLITERARCFYYVVMFFTIQAVTSVQKLYYH